MSEDRSDHKSLGYWAVVAIGVGGMVGGGIFAVLGLSVQLTGGAAPIAFAIAGIVALVTCYSYARLSVAYPTQGGTVTFLDRAFGSGLFTGSVNVLLWLSYIVMLSLYAYAFGSYGASLFPKDSQAFWRHVLLTGVIVGITGLNILSAKLVGEAEEWIVGIKIAVLVFFVGVGLLSVDPTRLAPGTWEAPLSVAAGGMVIFVAYEGFELIANTAQDVRSQEKTLPRAYFSAVGFVVLLYILVALVTVGNLSLDKIQSARDYALAAAARPFLGQAGYLMITIAALLSTASAINATCYGAARLSYIIAKDGELPEVLEEKVWHQPIEGLLITSGVTILVANFFDLSSISTMGSAGFLLIFAIVNAANVCLSEKTHSARAVSVIGVVLCVAALGALIWHTAVTHPTHLWVLGGLLVLAFAIEGSYQLFKGRELNL